MSCATSAWMATSAPLSSAPRPQHSLSRTGVELTSSLRPSPGSDTRCWGSSPRPKPTPNSTLQSLHPSRCPMSTPAAIANPSLPSRLADLHELLDQYVSAPTRYDDLDIVLAAVYAVQLGIGEGPPPFLVLFVDPPASGKTAIVMSVRPATERVVFLDALTQESFMSGAVSKQGAKSAKLLPMLNQQCLRWKDL